MKMKYIDNRLGFLQNMNIKSLKNQYKNIKWDLLLLL